MKSTNKTTLNKSPHNCNKFPSVTEVATPGEHRLGVRPTRGPRRAPRVRYRTSSPKPIPTHTVPAARLFFVFPCSAMCSSTWGIPEVGGGDNFLGSYRTLRRRAADLQPPGHYIILYCSILYYNEMCMYVCVYIYIYIYI